MKPSPRPPRCPGPYALSAFSDAIFQGQVTGGSPVNLHASHHVVIRTCKLQPALEHHAVYETQYATHIESLPPSTTSSGELEARGG